VPTATSGRFLFNAKWNINFKKSPDRHMKTSHASKLVVVIDDDPLVLEATGGLLRSWGCRVVAAESYDEAMTRLSEIGQRPDLMVDAIEMLRGAFEIPALLISGDANSPRSNAQQGGYHLLHKPVNAAAFRAALIEASVLRR
jgi:CheY-like chemotaxis protein